MSCLLGWLLFLGWPLVPPADAPRPGRSDTLLVLDPAAHPVGSARAGALYLLELGAEPDAAPRLVAAADRGAPFVAPTAVQLSRLDGRAYVTDRTAAGGRVLSVDLSSGRVDVAVVDDRLVNPTDLVELPNGELVVVDADAARHAAHPRCESPGPDSWPHGALFAFDPRDRELRLLSSGEDWDGYLHDDCSLTVFVDPIDATFDPVNGDLLVVDVGRVAPAGPPGEGLVFRVEPDSGRARVAAIVTQRPAQFGEHWPLAIAASPLDLVAVTTGDGSRSEEVWSLREEPDEPPPLNDLELLSGCVSECYQSQLTDLIFDRDGRLFVLDRWPSPLLPRGVQVVDLGAPLPVDNRVPLSTWEGWVSPADLSLGPRGERPLR